VAVLFLDLDRFKQVNDTKGHATGDALLREAAHRMSRMTRKQDTLARLGGDEFVLVLSELQRAEDATRVADKLVQALQEPFGIDGEDLRIGASIGIALAPQDSLDPGALLEKADLAMYRAKRGGRSAYCTFS
jgi:diguanylate cyclase (GGDEF)-like protein